MEKMIYNIVFALCAVALLITLSVSLLVHGDLVVKKFVFVGLMSATLSQFISQGNTKAGYYVALVFSYGAVLAYILAVARYLMPN